MARLKWVSFVLPIVLSFAAVSAGSFGTVFDFGASTKSLASAGLSARIYWTESPTGAPSDKGTVEDASRGGVDQTLVAGTRGGGDVAVNGDYVYWTNYETGAIGRANLDGSHLDQRFIVGANSPVGIAVYGAYIYWSNLLLFDGPANEFETTIGRARIDGSDVNQRFIVLSNGATIDGLAANSDHLYWADVSLNQIGRANRDGTDVDDAFITGANAPDGVGVDGNYLYWSNSGEGSIGRADLDGSSANQRCVVLGGPVGNEPEDVTTAGGSVYWTSYPGDAVGQASLDGAAMRNTFIKARGVPEGIALQPRRSIVTPDSSQCAASPEPIFLGTRSGFLNMGPYATGWGEVAPPSLSNGGMSASGTISSISWSSWGGPVATGQGLNPIFRPEGGYYSKPAGIQIQLSNVRRCTPGGALSYTTLSTREQAVPGGPLGPWYTADTNLCQGYGI